MERPELDLRQLHAFVVLAEELHFGRAAERLGVAQPPFSQQIRRLEERVGHPLFDRAARELTAVGAELLPAARRALDEVADGLEGARRVGRGEAGRLRVGFPASLALTVVPGVLAAFGRERPGVRVEMRELTTTRQLQALRGERIDVGLLRETREAEGLDVVPLLAEEVVAVLPSAHRLASRRRIEVADLAAEPFVFFPREHGPGFHDRLLGLARAAGFEPRVAQRAVEWQTVAGLVAAGLGVSLAPAGVSSVRPAGVVYRRLAGAPTTTVALAWRHGIRDPLVEAFVRLAVASGAALS
ncbi:LysR family transcriptional regulator [Nonomuraea sp. NPDC049152]|uniref:LysR family transcriptional regulator n=1 Tax=Nonomuraea sp. NPDC049152 TaxID=3154350 RepID=UPI0033D55E8D